MQTKRLVFGLFAAALTAGVLVAPRPASASHDDDCCDGGYRPRYRSGYRDRYYDDDYGYGRYSRSRASYSYSRSSYRYRCDDCGHSFSSSYWLNYHRRHSDCD